MVVQELADMWVYPITQESVMAASLAADAKSLEFAQMQLQYHPPAMKRMGTDPGPGCPRFG